MSLQLVAKISILFNILIVASVVAQLRLGTINRNPVKFDDDVLAASERVQYYRQYVPQLGFIRLLDTYMKPKSAEEVPTKFSIVNKRKLMRAIKFQPNTYCSLGESTKCTNSSYEFDLDQLIQSDFDVTTRTIIIVPGYFSKEEEDWVREMRELWLELDPSADVIQVSWVSANREAYSRAVAHTTLVARQITIFLHYLATLSGTSLNDNAFLSRIHMIGHSLGAHISGFVGQDLGGRLGRITGLDPAGPTFDLFNSGHRLDASDAKLVEVLHTNRGKMKYFNLAVTAPLHALGSLPLANKIGKTLGLSYNGEGDTAWYGIDQQIGHIDYYANNGRVQPGCSGLMHVCDHNRAYDIYVDLLRYELEFKTSVRSRVGDQSDRDWQMLLKASRIHAFRAEDFDSFVSGKSFAEQCSELLKFSGSEQNALSNFQYMRAYNSCSIPIDLTSPVDDFIDELRSYRGVSIEGDRPGMDMFFFRTLEENRLVGDHYMLKLHIEYEGSQWNDESCSLLTEIEMTTDNGDIDVSIDVNKLSHHIEYRQSIGITFNHADSTAGKIRLMNFMRSVKNEEAILLNEVEQDIQQIFPKRLTLNLIRPKTPSFLRSLRDTTLKMIKLDSTAAPCTLIINSVVLQPLDASQGGESNIVAIYRSELSDQKGGLSIFTGSQYSEELKDSQSKHGKIGKLSTSGRVSLTLTLQGLVIGT